MQVRIINLKIYLFLFLASVSLSAQSEAASSPQPEAAPLAEEDLEPASVALGAAASAAEQNNEESKLRQKLEEQVQARKQTIKYGIDSELVKIVDQLQSDKDEQYNNLLLERVSRGYSTTELQIKVINFFTELKWANMEAYVLGVLQKREQDSTTDIGLTTSALDYVSQLALSSATTAVLNLLDDPNLQIKNRSIAVIGKIGNRSSGAVLLGRLQALDSGELHESLELIKSIGLLKYRGAEEFLLGLLQDEKLDKQIHYMSYKALGQMQSAKAKALIISAFYNGASSDRFQALTALGFYAISPDIERVILQGLQESFWRSRIVAIQIIAAKKIATAIANLDYKMRKDPVAAVRNQSLRALIEIGSGGRTKVLELVQDETAPIERRISALEALIAKEDPEISTIMLMMLNEPDKYNIPHAKKRIYSIVAGAASKKNLAPIYELMLQEQEDEYVLMGLRAVRQGKLRNLEAELRKLAQPTNKNTKIRDEAILSLVQLAKN